MDKFIKESEKICLSGKDIQDKLNGKVNIVSYDKLNQFKNLDSLLGKYEACVILYLAEKNFGHWTCVFKRQDKKNMVEFFDPYGISIDLEKEWVDSDTKKRLKVEKNYLSYLLVNSNYIIEYNHFRLQKKESGVNTCGRWVVARLILRNLSLEDFYYLFKIKKNIKVDSDWLVTAITLF